VSVVILCGYILLLCVGLTAGIGNVQREYLCNCTGEGGERERAWACVHACVCVCMCVVILYGNRLLLCVGLTAGIGNVQRKSFWILIFSVQVLENYGEGLGKLPNKLLPTPFI
jgi:hypothetical protein